ncbi:methyltransferase domain-containing protein [Streptomyces syringium]|uniref:methyltransferase domain-containing protein n=2 Tax=Streptomyces syringium TaxID=76729 RepID=UPI0033DA76DB
MKTGSMDVTWRREELAMAAHNDSALRGSCRSTCQPERQEATNDEGDVQPMADFKVDALKVGEMYDSVSRFYEAWMGSSFHLSYWFGDDDDTSAAEAADRLTHKVGDTLGLLPSHHLLDAGCGTGGPAIALAVKTGARVTGISVSPVGVEFANNRAQEHGLSDRVHFEQGDYMSTRFGDDSFDAVLAIESLEHAPDLSQVLREFFRVLRPGGRFSLASYSSDSPMTKEEAERYRKFWMINFPPSLTEWLDVVRGAGFEVDEYTECGARVAKHAARILDILTSRQEELVAKFGQGPGVEESMAEFSDIVSLIEKHNGYVIIAARKPTR